MRPLIQHVRAAREPHRAWFAAAALSALLALSLSACSIGDITLSATKGSGTIKTETRSVSNFSRVSLTGIGTLNIKQGDTVSLTITTDDNLLPLLTSEVRGDTLYLGGKSGTIPQPTKGVTWDLSVTGLNGVQITGAGDVNVDSIATNTFTAQLSGVGNMTISGSATSQTVTISGAGNYNGRNFNTDNATITISGSGNATVNAKTKLDATISGLGSVTYYGEPQVSQKITGAGTVRQGK
jgi:hypothetical protein